MLSSPRPPRAHPSDSSADLLSLLPDEDNAELLRELDYDSHCHHLANEDGWFYPDADPAG